jgi:hypothetical protein
VSEHFHGFERVIWVSGVYRIRQLSSGQYWPEMKVCTAAARSEPWEVQWNTTSLGYGILQKAVGEMQAELEKLRAELADKTKEEK